MIFLMINQHDSHDHFVPSGNLIEAEWRIYVSVNKTSLVQIMTCRLVGAKPLSQPKLVYCQLDPWNLNRNTKIFIHYRIFNVFAPKQGDYHLKWVHSCNTVFNDLTPKHNTDCNELITKDNIQWPNMIQFLTHWGRDKMAAIFKCIVVNKNAWILIKISLKFVT